MKRYALSISLTLLAFMFAVPVHTAHANANTPVFEKTYEESFRYKMHGVDYDKTAVKNWYFDVKTGKIAFITDAKVEDILKSTGSKLNNGWGLVSYSPLVARGETYHADDKHTYYTPIYSFDDAGQMLAKKVFQSRSSEANFLSIAPDSFLVTYRLSEDGTYRTSKDYLDVVTPPGMESKTFEIKDPKIARAYGGTGDMLGEDKLVFSDQGGGEAGGIYLHDLQTGKSSLLFSSEDILGRPSFMARNTVSTIRVSDNERYMFLGISRDSRGPTRWVAFVVYDLEKGEFVFSEKFGNRGFFSSGHFLRDVRLIMLPNNEVGVSYTDQNDQTYNFVKYRFHD
ncbi:MAG: hypothetical protein OXT65_07425 [Alphaproteobacteria bacterium]|nr:hypothetical protein [Alphaproteobacteria bacterium]